MPRVARIDAPGVIHHVMVRGIERRPIFQDDHDRHDLAARLSRIVPDGGTTCLAWAFMPNHVHLVVRTGTDSVSRLMARVGTGYARRFNERHERVGHLFQNRFHSRIVADDADLLCVIRYVHLNPLAAGIVANLDELAVHPWTGHAGLLGRLEAQPFHAAREALRVFGTSDREARERLRSLMEVGVDDPGVGTPGIAPSDESSPRSPEVRLAEAAVEICRCLQLDPIALRSRSRDRTVSRARAALAVRAIRTLGIPLTQVARWLHVSKGSVSRAVSRDRCFGDVPESNKGNKSKNVPTSTKATKQERPQGNNVPVQP